MSAEDSKYSVADDVEFLAKELIQNHHAYLANARIVYLFRAGKWIKGDKIRFGQCKLASEDIRFIAEFDFVITINLDAREVANAQMRLAVVDHELCHCDYTENEQGDRKWCVRDHDVQEFVAIVHRHGLWDTELQKLVIASRDAPYVDGPHNQIDIFSQKTE